MIQRPPNKQKHPSVLLIYTAYLQSKFIGDSEWQTGALPGTPSPRDRNNYRRLRVYCLEEGEYVIFIVIVRLSIMKVMAFLIIFLLAGSQPALIAAQSCTRGAAVISADSPHRCCCSGMPCCCCNKGMHKEQGASSHAKNPYGTCTNPFCSAASGMPGQETAGGGGGQPDQFVASRTGPSSPSCCGPTFRTCKPACSTSSLPRRSPSPRHTLLFAFDKHPRMPRLLCTISRSKLR